MDYFPAGIWHYLVGGLIVGTAVSALFLTTGVRAGASGVLSSALSYLSNHPSFTRLLGERRWRTQFSIGLILGAAIFTVGFDEMFTTDVSILRLAVGGFLVGVGVRQQAGDVVVRDPTHLITCARAQARERGLQVRLVPGDALAQELARPCRIA